MEVGRLCANESDERQLRADLVSRLREYVAFDGYVWLLTDPTTGVGWSPLAEIPDESDLPTLIRLRYRSTRHQWVEEPGPGPVDAPADPWLVHLGTLGVVDVLTVVHRDAQGCWAFLDLWRRDGSFDPGEKAFVASMSTAVTSALRTRQQATFAIAADRRPGSGPAVLVLTDDLTIRSRTDAADQFLSRLLPADGGREVIPAAAYNVAARLLAVEAGPPDGPATSRAFVPGAGWLQLKASRLLSSTGGGKIAVTVEMAPADERLELFGRVHAFTPRERDVMTQLAGGLDNHGLATALGVSDHTVQDHLKSLHSKTGARSRGELLSLALGRPSAG